MMLAMQRLDRNSSMWRSARLLSCYPQITVLWNVKNSNIPNSHLLMNKMDIELDVLRVTVRSWICEEANGSGIVAIHHDGLVDGAT